MWRGGSGRVVAAACGRTELRGRALGGERGDSSPAGARRSSPVWWMGCETKLGGTPQEGRTGDA